MPILSFVDDHKKDNIGILIMTFANRYIGFDQKSVSLNINEFNMVRYRLKFISYS